MAKVISIDDLKPILAEVLTEENSTGVIEGVMAKAVDYDEDSIQGRIDEAVNAARDEAKAEYSKKVHDMFFGSAEEKVIEDAPDDSKIDPEIADNDVQVSDIFIDEVN